MGDVDGGFPEGIAGGLEAAWFWEEKKAEIQDSDAIPNIVC